MRSRLSEAGEILQRNYRSYAFEQLKTSNILAVPVVRNGLLFNIVIISHASRELNAHRYRLIGHLIIYSFSFYYLRLFFNSFPNRF